jgi:hypothetical protein
LSSALPISSVAKSQLTAMGAERVVRHRDLAFSPQRFPSRLHRVPVSERALDERPHCDERDSLPATPATLQACLHASDERCDILLDLTSHPSPSSIAVPSLLDHG